MFTMITKEIDLLSGWHKNIYKFSFKYAFLENTAINNDFSLNQCLLYHFRLSSSYYTNIILYKAVSQTHNISFTF